MNYEWNEYGVCLEPEIVFHCKHPKSLAGDYAQVKIANYKNLWYYGYWYPGGASPCSKSGIGYTTSEEAKEQGLRDLVGILENLDIGIKTYSQYYYDELRMFIQPQQLSMF